MSILGSIFSKILGHHDGASANPAQTPGSSQPQSTPASDAGPPPPVSAPPSSSAPAGAGTAAPAAGATVDVAAILDGLAAKNAQKLDWRHSIVDMMKLIGLDSSLTARQSLAQELHYSGNAQDSAAMNVWLHRQVMAKLAENGGKVPDDLRH